MILGREYSIQGALNYESAWTIRNQKSDQMDGKFWVRELDKQ